MPTELADWRIANGLTWTSWEIWKRSLRKDALVAYKQHVAALQVEEEAARVLERACFDPADDAGFRLPSIRRGL